MSSEVFPELPGIKISLKLSPEFKTLSKESASGIEYRVALRPVPRWKLSLSFEFLRAGTEAELQTLVDFFVARKGAFDSFLFPEPDDLTGLGTTLTVRFAHDYQDFDRFLEDLWEAKKVDLITLL